MCFSPPDRLSLTVAERAKTLSGVKTYPKKNSTTLPRSEHGEAEYIYMVADVLLIEGVVLHNICFNSQDRESQSVKVLCCCNKSISLTRVSG